MFEGFKEWLKQTKNTNWMIPSKEFIYATELYASCLSKIYENCNKKVDQQTIKVNDIFSICITDDRQTIITPFEDTTLVSFGDMYIKYAESKGVPITQCGRGEYLVKISYDFDKYMSRHRFGRYYKKALSAGYSVIPEERTKFLIDSNDIGDIFVSNCRHFNDRNLKPYYDLYDYKKDIGILGIRSHKYWKAFIDMPNTSVYGVVYEGKAKGFIFLDLGLDKKELHWVNSVFLRDRQADQVQLGNFMIMSAIKIAHDEGYEYLNMGLDVFEYKKLWGVEHKWRPGFADGTTVKTLEVLK